MALKQCETTSDTRELASLVLAARDGDRRAFEALFERYRRAVYAIVLRRLGDEAEAQELCQEVFIQAMRKLHQLHTPVCFGGWLRAIARRMALNRAIRRRATVRFESDRVEADYPEQETPLGSILAQERRDRVRAGLSRLSALDRDTLVAFYFRGQSLVQMSDAFDSPVGTIKRRLHVARKRLAKELASLAPA
jgi:RNA polymerase sigma-70 factor (ECF subfamily)